MQPARRLPAPRFIYAIIVLCSLVWLFGEITQSQATMAMRGGLVPARLTMGLVGQDGSLPAWMTIATSAFLHGSMFHLLSNMLVLYVAGRVIEPVLGWARTAILYAVAQLAGVAFHIAFNWESIAPMYGASGAVAGVFACYALLFNNQKAPALIGSSKLSLALWLAASWIILQLMSGYAFNGPDGAQIAVAAHVGGFLAGLLATRPLLKSRFNKKPQPI